MVRQRNFDRLPEPDARHTAFRVSLRLTALLHAGSSPGTIRKKHAGFHFDTEIIIQVVLAKPRIAELPIPTFYGEEICHVTGLKYAWDIFRSTSKGRLCGSHLFYDRKFDLDPGAVTHSDKLGFSSSQSFAVETCVPNDSILQLGIGHQNVADELQRLGYRVTTIDFAANDLTEKTGTVSRAPRPQLPPDLSGLRSHSSHGSDRAFARFGEFPG